VSLKAGSAIQQRRNTAHVAGKKPSQARMQKASAKKKINEGLGKTLNNSCF
jgi:hypothetical protein